MQSVLKALAVVSLLAIAGFCGFGFLASFEYDIPRALPWAIGYGFFGLASLGGAISTLISALKLQRSAGS